MTIVDFNIYDLRLLFHLKTVCVIIMLLPGCQSSHVHGPHYDEASKYWQKLYQPTHGAHQDRVYEHKILTLAPNSEFALYIKADLLYNRGEYRKALSLSRQAIDNNDQVAEFYNLAGLCLKQLDRIEESTDYFEDGLDFAPNNLSLLINLGNLNLASLQFDEALKNFQKVIQLEPSSAAAHNGLAYTLFNMGHHQSATNACQKARQLEPTDTSSIWLAGALLWETGFEKESRKYFRICCRMGDGDCCRDQKRNFPTNTGTLQRLR